MTPSGLEEAVGRITGARPRRLSPLGGGCVAEVYRVDLEGGDRLVAKVGGDGAGLETEGFMLAYLAENSLLPVPRVIHAEDSLLLMTFIDTSGGLTTGAQEHAAGLIAALHDITGDAFGLSRDTLIGGLHQPNPWTESWIEFFRHHRLLNMGRQGLDAGRLPAALMGRLETLAARLDRWLEEPEQPSLLHGDLWGGNVLCFDDRIAAFIDPAVYYGDAEIELAFGTLFGTFGDPFFARYRELRPLRPGFFEQRRDLYNLYPLLVHVRLFGGSYVASVERTLTQFGC